MPASCLASLSPPLEVTFRILSARGFHARRLGINRPVATVPSGSAAASTDPWQEEVAMAEPTVVIAPTTVPREDLGHGEPLLMTAKQVKKTPGLEREGWWRLTITDTPIPGTYHFRTFTEEALLNPVKITYNFKNEGRKKLPLVLRNDPVPTDLPQYSPPDFLELLKKQTASYSFKDKPRADPSTLVDKDESLHLCPGQYEVLPAPVPKSPARSFVFRSSVQRFPPNYFTPHEGPGPGDYELKASPKGSITSCFRSKVPRFLPVSSQPGLCLWSRG
ncbi:protein STPG4 isoform X3 [Mus musculus]|uniref:protein STPG4 isoform X3 n=1 Tax=Mus musculus TaxID=10090 RepID=UPI0007ED7A71|nr:protein STPG4 isoform X3 [Mus musculus]|eukprot:XP_017173196.1 PREDICTED: uncharacterized protein C2orf61 homolog isoform X3 [Mus musculus]